MVGVAGGDGVGVLIGLWQDLGTGRDEGEDEDDESREEDDEEEEEEEREGSGRKMMAEVHWCFRRQDLPSIMKNLNVQDVSHSLPLAMTYSRTDTIYYQWHDLPLTLRTKSFSPPHPSDPSPPSFPSLFSRRQYRSTLVNSSKINSNPPNQSSRAGHTSQQESTGVIKLSTRVLKVEKYGVWILMIGEKGGGGERVGKLI
jgi:hypothetical protein